MKKIIALLVLIAACGLFLVAWHVWGDEYAANQSAHALNEAVKAVGNPVKSGDWKSVSVVTSRGPKRMMARAVTPALATMRQMLVTSKDLAALQLELETAQNISAADKKFYQAAIEDYCLGVAVSYGWVARTTLRNYSGIDELEGFLSQGEVDPAAQGAPPSQPSDPKYNLRRQAKATLVENNRYARCAGFRGRPISVETVEAKMKEAAALGDTRSAGMLAAWGIIDGITQKEVMASSGFGSTEPKRPFITSVIHPPTAEQVTQITAAISTGDPAAILSLGHTLSQSYERSQFYFGENGEGLEYKLREYLWPMLACEYGANCRADTNQYLLKACANDGICDIPDLETYIKSHKLNERELAQYERLKPLFLHAINTGDWRFMSTTPGPLPPGSTRYLYLNGMRIPMRFGW